MLGDRLVSMQMWDTAGQEKYQSVQRVFYRGSDACVLTYDITDIKSFQNLPRWKEEFINACTISAPDKFPLVLLGNKSDLSTERKVGTETQCRSPMPRPPSGARKTATSSTTKPRPRPPSTSRMPSKTSPEKPSKTKRASCTPPSPHLLSEIGGISKINFNHKLTQAPAAKKDLCQC